MQIPDQGKQTEPRSLCNIQLSKFFYYDVVSYVNFFFIEKSVSPFGKVSMLNLFTNEKVSSQGKGM